jgi:hypothetical protein
MMMRTLRSPIVVVAVASVVVLLGGCKKKKAPTPQAQAPTLSAPAGQPAAAPTAGGKPNPATPAPATSAAAKPKPKPKHHPAAAKKVAPAASDAATAAAAKPPTQAETQPAPKLGDVAIREGSGGGTATRDQQTTEQLLAATEANLNSLKRALTADEQSTVAQIKDYVVGARKAAAENDAARAHNLALKAYLLSDELVKR